MVIAAGGRLSVSASTFSGNVTNSSFSGGALRFVGTVAPGGFLIRNSTFSGNSAGLNGGAIGFGTFSGTATIQNSTITANTAGTTGGGGGIGVNAGSTGVINIESCIVSGNSLSGTGTGPDLFTGSTLNAVRCGVGSSAGVTTFVPDATTTNLLGKNLQLGPLQANGGFTATHALGLNSPAVDQGSNPAPAFGTDQRGAPFGRQSGSLPDIGAYEFQSLNLAVDSTSDLDDQFYGVGQLSLREAITLANANPLADTITFNLGGAATITLGGTQLPALTDTVATTSIQGPGIAQLTVSGDLKSRVFQINTGVTVMISNLTVTAGNAAGNLGGGIFNRGALTLSNTLISGNTANNGAGVYSTIGTLTVTASTVRNNTASFNGGGLNCSASMSIIESAIYDNSAFNGGGFGSFFGTATVINSTICNNTAATGGGIQNGTVGGTVVLTNSTVNRNTAIQGGGINNLGTVSAVNSIVGGNTASTDSDSNGTVTSTNSLINLSAAALRLGTLGNYGGSTLTIPLLPGSPAIDAGTSSVTTAPLNLTHDQRGLARFAGATVDIGAFELDSIAISVDSSADTNDGNYSTGNLTLREALTIASLYPLPDTITFDFPGATTITLTGTQLPALADVAQLVTIQSPGAKLLTVSANKLSRVFRIDNGVSAFISGMTITGGNVPGGFGGAVDSRGNLTLSDVIISGNSAALGGGIYHLTGSLNISNSIISNNRATTTGGGLSVSGTLTITSSTLAGNSAPTGGGIKLFNTTLAVTNSTIAANNATTGGGIYQIGVAGTATIINSTVTGNTASSAGGGVYSIRSISVTSTVVSGNLSGIGNGSDISSNAAVTLNQCAVGSASGFVFGSGSNNLPTGIDLKLGSLDYFGGPTPTFRPALDSPLRGKGSNPSALNYDQRGLPRTILGVIDIGAVQVDTTQVVAIARANATPTAAGAVSWNLVFAGDISGLHGTNFALTGPGATGATITGVIGTGKYYTVSALTGADGELRLTLANTDQLDVIPANAPFVGESYFVDKSPLAVSLSTSVVVINDAVAAVGMFQVTATFSEGMDTSVTPSIDFPVEIPGVSMLPAGGAWTTPTTFVATFAVSDLNFNLSNIDVRVSGGKDTAGNAFGSFTKASLFSIDTRNPVIAGISLNDANPTKASSVSWTVTLSEPVSGVSASTFALVNGGLGGNPAITAVSGTGTTWTVTASTGSGQGILSLLVTGSAGVVDGAGNPLAALPVAGPGYSVDMIAPAAAKVSVNLLTVTPADVGPGGFQVSVQYSELMNQSVAPLVTFPVENPGPTLVPAGGVWLDARTYRADFNVVNLALALPDIDVAITSGKDSAGNTQAPFAVADVFDIEMAVPARVNAVIINGGAAQRSRVTTIAVQFDQFVTFAGSVAGAFQLTRQSDSKSPALSAAATISGPGTVVTLTFSGTDAVDFGSLADGRFTLSIAAGQITGSGLDGNGDGTAGDDYALVGDTTNKLFRLYGDADGSGQVTSSDFLAFRLAFLSPSLAFDYNGSGTVDSSDFLQFRLRFLQSV